jgi:hypothetical protein
MFLNTGGALLWVLEAPMIQKHFSEMFLNTGGAVLWVLEAPMFRNISGKGGASGGDSFRFGENYFSSGGALL